MVSWLRRALDEPSCFVTCHKKVNDELVISFLYLIVGCYIVVTNGYLCSLFSHNAVVLTTTSSTLPLHL